MRRPAQHHFGPTASTAWAHPYTGPFALSVFHADGDPAPAPASSPSPADLAAQAQKNPPAVEPIRDADGVVITQERFGQNMAKERRAGRHAAFRELAEAAGVDFDIDSFDPKKFGEMFKQADEARKAKLTEDERRSEALRQQAEELATRATQVEQREAAARQLHHDTRIRAALVSLGASGADLEDAAALLRVPDDVNDDDLVKAATELKERRAEMFGGQPAAPGTQPPAPSGMPAPGMPRPGASQPKPGERGLAMLKRRGKIAADA
ncbi:hypothetical protein [Streptomyces sp. NPDC047868]|uniref:hypothetical protein n=1 Tax=Streptomyces sp. NPDC047868 TaxID=3155480 RepID=UPI0034544CFB